MYVIGMTGPISRLCTGDQNFQLCHHLGLWEVYVADYFQE